MSGERSARAPLAVVPDDVPAEIVTAMGAPPTPEQWTAISMPLGPSVLVAGAGSGKTSVMAARVVYLTLVALGRIPGRDPSEGVLAGNVLCLTFTVKATENLREKVRRALGPLDLPGGEEPEILNYNGFAQQVLDRTGMLAGIEPGGRLLSRAQRVALAGRVLDEMSFEHVPTEWQPTVVDKILMLDEQAQNHLVDPARIVAHNRARLELLANQRSDRAFRSARERIELAEAVQVFRRLKRERGVIDFGDQIELAARVAVEHPQVGAAYRDRFAAVLLDEYQDTNVAQARLMESLFGGGHPVTAVGDPDQNIYAWRGASLANLLEFPTRFPQPGGEPAPRLPLFTNFRSGSRILAAADRIIAPLPESQRPEPGKVLVPWPENGEGEVTVASHRDELTEARWIADRIVALHEGGSSWGEIAVLCRTSRLFTLLADTLGDRDVPAEIVGLAGLLRRPEVVEVLAYARAVADPHASAALARILLGPRYRIGYKDLALVARWARSRNTMAREAGDEEETPYLLAEALEHLDEVEGLSDEARARLEGFAAELASLRAEARRPVADFLAEIVRRTGIAAELDASTDRVAAEQRSRNLAAFLEHVHAFEPLEGELTLRALLDHADETVRLEREEWEPVQATGRDTVKVMTIHQAKGLEFDHVFVPGVAGQIMPSMRIQQNPAERGSSLDFELRGDAALLPAFDGVLSRFKGDLRAQEVIEERRTMYVALTRARRTLWVSASRWYGENVNAKGSSPFFRELVEWAEASGEAEVVTTEPAEDEGAAAEGEGGGASEDEENPMLGYRQGLVRPWPGPAGPGSPGETDALFAGGWRAAAAEAASGGGVQPELVEALSAEERQAFDRAAVDHRTIAANLREREEREAAVDGATTGITSLGVSDLSTYALCPRRFSFTKVRRLPRFPGARARIGTQVHAWIERQAQGQGRLLEPDDDADLTVDDLADGGGQGSAPSPAQLREAFLATRFADRVPLMAERAFLLRLGGFAVRGRIDAIFGEAAGPWEIVDWKTGRQPPPDDPSTGIQLDLYGLAAVEVWGKVAEDLTLTYVYLGDGTEVSRPMGDPDLVRTDIEARLADIAAERFEPTPGRWCGHCDFRAFCEEGSAWLAEARSDVPAAGAQA